MIKSAKEHGELPVAYMTRKFDNIYRPTPIVRRCYYTGLSVRPRLPFHLPYIVSFAAVVNVINNVNASGSDHQSRQPCSDDLQPDNELLDA